MSVSRLVNRSVITRGGRISMGLEPELWDALQEIGKREEKDVNTLVREVEAAGYTGGRTSAVRVFITTYFRSAATEIGHAAVGHSGLRLRRTHQRQEVTLTEGPSWSA